MVRSVQAYFGGRNAPQHHWHVFRAFVAEENRDDDAVPHEHQRRRRAAAPVAQGAEHAQRLHAARRRPVPAVVAPVVGQGRAGVESDRELAVVREEIVAGAKNPARKANTRSKWVAAVVGAARRER